jgi:hypothetical protein
LSFSLGRGDADRVLTLAILALALISVVGLGLAAHANQKLPTVMASGFLSNQSAGSVVASWVDRNAASSRALYEADCVLKDLTIGIAASVTCNVSYVDWESQAHSVAVTSVSVAGVSSSSPLVVLVKGGSSISVSTAVVGTATFDVGAAITLMGAR